MEILCVLTVMVPDSYGSSLRRLSLCCPSINLILNNKSMETLVITEVPGLQQGLQEPPLSSQGWNDEVVTLTLKDFLWAASLPCLPQSLSIRSRHFVFGKGHASFCC